MSVMNITELLDTAYETCSGCGELTLIPTINSNTLCYDCLGVGFAKYPRSYQKTPIPKDLRQAVLQRDNFTCRNCGSTERPQADHIHPESKGGETTLKNLQTLCRSCNTKKGIGS